MRVKVGGFEFLKALSRFKPEPKARLQANAHPGGIEILANRQGYLTLARWCLLMAHEDRPSDLRILDAPDVGLAETVNWDYDSASKGLVLNFDGMEPGPDEVQDIRFWLYDGPGEEFWGNALRSCDSKHAVSRQRRLNSKYAELLMMRSVAEIGEALGAGERVSGFMGSELWRFRIPEGWLLLETDAKGATEAWYFE